MERRNRHIRHRSPELKQGDSVNSGEPDQTDGQTLETPNIKMIACSLENATPGLKASQVADHPTIPYKPT